MAPCLHPLRARAHRRNEIVAAADLPAFHAQLLGWFAEAKRDLDWRATRDPYRVWISEIMLQQTRVAAVVPYYRRFLERFPTVNDLAGARIDAVLRHWAGLGYYSRARNLHRAAKEIVARHGGEFPRLLEDALALPGIGRYTAAAVLSIAYGEPLAVLDGNVARVLARLGAIRGDLRRPRRWRALSAAADALLPARRKQCPRSRQATPGDWNQAMMELGATVCTPRAPRCDACPVSRWCRAHALGIALRLPSPRRKPKPVRLALSAAVLLDPRGRTLLVRQKSGHSALFSNLWHFPAVQSPASKPGSPQKLAAYLRSDLASPPQLEPLPPARHTVTFRRILLAPYLVRVPKLPRPNSRTAGAVRTPRLADLGRLPISSATKKIAASARLGHEKSGIKRCTSRITVSRGPPKRRRASDAKLDAAMSAPAMIERPSASVTGESAIPYSALGRYFEISLFLLLLVSVLALVSTGKLDLVSIGSPRRRCSSKATAGGGAGARRSATARPPSWWSSTFSGFPWTCGGFRGISPPTRRIRRCSRRCWRRFTCCSTPWSCAFSAPAPRATIFSWPCWPSAPCWPPPFSPWTPCSCSSSWCFWRWRSPPSSAWRCAAVPRARSGRSSRRARRSANRLQRALGITSGIVAIAALAAGAVIFFLIPRFNAGYLSGFNLQPSLITGFSDDVELGQIGEIKKSSEVVMRITVRGNPLIARNMHWRGIALTTFDGRRWYTESHDPAALGEGFDGWITVPPETPVERRYSLPLAIYGDARAGRFRRRLRGCRTRAHSRRFFRPAGCPAASFAALISPRIKPARWPILSTISKPCVTTRSPSCPKCPPTLCALRRRPIPKRFATPICNCPSSIRA